MKKRIFITATNTDIGKTYAGTLLLEALTQQGLKVGVFKPIETGVLEVPLDGTKLFEKARALNPALNALTIRDIVPYQYPLPAAPYVAKGQDKIDMDFLESALKKIEALCDVVLIEGAGGLMVPIEKDFFMVDLINFFKASVFLVVPSRLGSINDTLLSRFLLEQKGIHYTWAVNLHTDKECYEQITAPFYDGNELILQRDIQAIANKL